MKRLEYVDIMKGLGMILVILGHINAYNSIYKPYLYSFHMVIFFFSYGYVAQCGKKNIKETFVKRFKTLIVPYFLWAFLYSGFSLSSAFYVAYGSHKSIALVSNSSLWFLPTFFVSVILFELLLYAFSKRKVDNKKSCIILLALSFLYLIGYIFIYDLLNGISLGIPWGVDAALTGVVLISFGYVFRSIFEKYKLLDKSFGLHLIMIFVLLIATFTYVFNNVDYVLLAENKIGNPFMFIFTGLSGTILVLLISLYISKIKINWLRRIFVYIGKNTLFIMSSQMIFIVVISAVTLKLGFNSIISIFIVLILTLVSTCVSSFICCKFVPQLNGK